MLIDPDALTLVDTFHAILGASAATYWIVLGFAAVLFPVMRSILPDPDMALVYLPFASFGGLAAPYGLKMNGFAFTNEVYTNTVLAVACGMSAVIVALILLTRAWYAVSAKGALNRTEIPVPRRQRDLGRVLRRGRDE